MTLLTFQEIDQIMIEHRRAEEARNAPAAVACRALDELREAMTSLPRAERMEVVYLLGQLVSETIDATHDGDDRSWELTQDLTTVPF